MSYILSMGEESELKPLTGLTGLVLTGGGARGAYQAGALAAIFEMAEKRGISWPFPIVTGTSAGAINAAFLATHAHERINAAYKLKHLWETLTVDQVYKDDIFSLSKIGIQWLATLSLGGFSSKKKSLSLLNTKPLHLLLKSALNFDHLGPNIDSGLLYAFALTAMNYSTGTGQTFFQGHPAIRPWTRIRREGIRAQITTEHVLASSAIPILFPPVKIGSFFYGDGNLRDYTPFSPAINLGASKLIVIGVKKAPAEIDETRLPSPSIARILSVVLNTILLDSLDLDHERMERINQTISFVPKGAPIRLKNIDVCVIRPSENIGTMAIEEAERLPKTLLHLLHGLGTLEEASELISYLLFMPSFTKRLTQLGYEDAYRQADKINEFLQPWPISS